MALSQNELMILSVASVIALLIGILLGAYINSRKAKQIQYQADEISQQNQQRLEEQLGQLTEQYHLSQSKLELAHEHQLDAQRKLGELEQKNEQILLLREEKQQIQHQLHQSIESGNELKTQLESQLARFTQERIAFEEKIELLKSAEVRLQEQFENLANKIFEQKQEKFTQTSKAGLDALLSPLKEQIEGFKKQVTDQYVKEGQERASLKTEILGLKELNQQITHEASALTKALKGDNKQQGNWGEVVLERILTESGLREGHEYHTQAQYKDEHGKAFKPDVVVQLPNEKQVVIDSKVSLNAYERYFNEQDEGLRHSILTEHVNSLRTHIKDLGKKDYHKLEGVKTLDYILMFIPIEPAFLVAIDQAPELVKLALDNNIMLVSPTNLLVALRTINNIWQYEHQNQNAQVIAKKAADLYDKFVGFTTDLEGLGTSLDTVHKKYSGAMNKLTDGKGNLVRRMEEFKTLGVQTSKKQSQKLLDSSE